MRRRIQGFSGSEGEASYKRKEVGNLGVDGFIRIITPRNSRNHPKAVQVESQKEDVGKGLRSEKS